MVMVVVVVAVIEGGDKATGLVVLVRLSMAGKTELGSFTGQENGEANTATLPDLDWVIS